MRTQRTYVATPPQSATWTCFFPPAGHLLRSFLALSSCEQQLPSDAASRRPPRSCWRLPSQHPGHAHLTVSGGAEV